ncbi:arginine/serine-rich protein PNISR isoform X2 [Daktulosphaira vitifoliae]|uniref:arginine/serine-rich protein PNISR isoform X2 n=1 Tax=Daktulosphaira vitifoliae TaxID=58002 RepID=UPI0021AAA448|nr:arginine/serine-rich protein PNISR isoform X2 [Daktulosphaira vitifoliae]
MWLEQSSTMAYGNQWMNPALYQNMNNEQVDWASLAQQWIKMKETTPQIIQPGQNVRSVPCETTTDVIGQQSNPSHNPLNIQGSSKPVCNPNVGNNIDKPSAWNTWTWQQQQQWNWNWAPPNIAPIPIKAPRVEPVMPIRPPYSSPVMAVEPESFTINTPNRHFSTNSYWPGSNPKIAHPTETDQWTKSNLVSSADDKIQDPAFIDAIKRKQLPAWIREGLEKMEREKRRKMEQELSNDLVGPNINIENTSDGIPNSPNTFKNDPEIVEEDIDHDSIENNIEDDLRKNELPKNESSSFIPHKSKAQIWEDTMLSLRQILTKLLMDVTNDMMLSVVKEVLKTTSYTDTHGNQNQTSLAGKLGLGVYGSASESSEESDDGNYLTGHNISHKKYSDEILRERLLKRQREFSNIEARILMELDKLEDREKLVRSKFDNTVKFSGSVNDTVSKVVENIQSQGQSDNEEENQKLKITEVKPKTEKSSYNSIKNGNKKKKSKSKRSSSSESSSSSSESSKSDDSDSKYSKKIDKYRSKASNKKSRSDIRKKSRSRSGSRSYVRSKRSRSHSRNRSNSRSKRNDRKSSHNYRSRRSRSPVSRHKKHKNKRNSSSSSNESRSTKHRYRR